MTDKTKTEVAVVADTKVVAMEGYDMSELLADAKKGSEGLSAEDIAIPFLGILQALSPQCIEGKEGYIEGAKASMFFDNVTGKIYEGRKNGVLLIPCHYRKVWITWNDRDSGGGLVDISETDDVMKGCIQNDKKQWVVATNPKLIVFETAQHYVLRLNMETGETERMVMSFKSTGLKANRKWNHLITSAKIPGHPTVTAPRFMFAYNAKTFLEEKNNNSWWSADFERLPDPVSKPVYDEAKAYYEMASSGKIKLSEEPVPVAETSGNYRDDDAAGEGGTVSEDEIPF